MAHSRNGEKPIYQKSQTGAQYNPDSGQTGVSVELVVVVIQEVGDQAGEQLRPYAWVWWIATTSSCIRRARGAVCHLDDHFLLSRCALLA